MALAIERLIISWEGHEAASMAAGRGRPYLKQ
jgi:hypothetical protein